MSTEFDREQINKLISEKRHEEAKAILRQSADPAAKQWLSNLEQHFPPAAPVSRPQSSPGAWSYGSGSAGSAGTSGYALQQERGGCLTAWLTLATIVNPLVGLYYLFNSRQLLSILRLPSWVIPVLVIGSIVNTVAVIGVWQWKRWGVYLFTGTGILVFFLNLATLGVSTGTFGGLLGLGLLWFLVRDKWAQFE